MNIFEASRLLEIESSLANIDEDDVEHAYRSQLIKNHPDRFPNDPDKIKWANEYLKQCAMAKDVIMAKLIVGSMDYEYDRDSSAEREWRPEEYYIIRIQNSGSQKAWVAEIVGRHPKYQLNRKWVEVGRWYSRDDKQYRLQAGGLYEVNNPAKDERYFVYVHDGFKISIWDKYQVMSFVR